MMNWIEFDVYLVDAYHIMSKDDSSFTIGYFF